MASSRELVVGGFPDKSWWVYLWEVILGGSVLENFLGGIFSLARCVGFPKYRSNPAGINNIVGGKVLEQ